MCLFKLFLFYTINIYRPLRNFFSSPFLFPFHFFFPFSPFILTLFAAFSYTFSPVLFLLHFLNELNLLYQLVPFSIFPPFSCLSPCFLSILTLFSFLEPIPFLIDSPFCFLYCSAPLSLIYFVFYASLFPHFITFSTLFSYFPPLSLSFSILVCPYRIVCFRLFFFCALCSLVPAFFFFVFSILYFFPFFSISFSFYLLCFLYFPLFQFLSCFPPFSTHDFKPFSTFAFFLSYLFSSLFPPEFFTLLFSAFSHFFHVYFFL